MNKLLKSYQMENLLWQNHAIYVYLEFVRTENQDLKHASAFHRCAYCVEILYFYSKSIKNGK
jgi:hypothetical protein